MPPRLAITTVIQMQGPAKAPTQARAQQLASPMREEIYTADKVSTPAMVATALQRISRHQEETTAAARSFPFFGGAYWASVTFKANTAVTLAHGCPSGLSVGWSAFSVRPLGAVANAVANGRIVEISQQPSTGRITLSSNENSTADLYFFTRPVAT